MSQVFLKIINMSISASYIVLAVMLLRLLLRKAPKWITVIFWGIVAIRLVCPFSVESVLSLIPSAETVSPGIMTDSTPAIHTGISFLNSVVNPMLSESLAPVDGASANPLQIWIPILTAVWAFGIVAMLIYVAITYVRIKRRVGTAVLFHDNIYQSEYVTSPFVLGILKPRIYLPFDQNEQSMAYVTAHEMAHIRRKDHIWKPLGFLLLALHWFNPLLWVGYILLCRDIELACDEKVIKTLERDARADYSQALLACSTNRRMIAACPLAFGEVGVKARVKSVIHYKRPAFWLVVAAIAACITAAVCFLTNPPKENVGQTNPEQPDAWQQVLMEIYPEYFGLDASNGLDVYVWQMAPSSYSFAVAPHLEQEKSMKELLELSGRGAYAREMRAILATYNIDEEDINIIPWYPLHSSYIADWQIVLEGEDPEVKRQAYIQSVRKMLFEPQTENAYLYGTYTRENSNDIVFFTISLYENESYTYFESSRSSHIGMGTYTFENGIITLVDENIPGVHGTLTHTFKFRYEEGKLIFLAEESDDFMYISLPEGAVFELTDAFFYE